MLSRYDYTLDPPLHKMTRLVDYKYIIRSLEERFTILIFYYIYVFRAFISKIFFYFLSLKK
jgi:hypothetical protein